MGLVGLHQEGGYTWIRESNGSEEVVVTLVSCSTVLILGVPLPVQGQAHCLPIGHHALCSEDQDCMGILQAQGSTCERFGVRRNLMLFDENHGKDSGFHQGMSSKQHLTRGGLACLSVIVVSQPEFQRMPRRVAWAQVQNIDRNARIGLMGSKLAFGTRRSHH